MAQVSEHPTSAVPMFPLGTVLFPGMSVPLRVFEDRYRALVHHLLREPDPAMRLFGSVAIREGYEVGEHGAQSLYRVGCLLQLTEVEANPDGTFEVVAVGRDRIRLDRLEAGGPYPAGQVTMVPEAEVAVSEELLSAARDTFTAYRAAVSAYRADPLGDPGTATLPKDPTMLSWTLAAVAPLPMAERQALLEAEDAAQRLTLVTGMLRQELRAMSVIASLPATEMARTRWSPN